MIKYESFLFYLLPKENSIHKAETTCWSGWSVSGRSCWLSDFRADMWCLQFHQDVTFLVTAFPMLLKSTQWQIASAPSQGCRGWGATAGRDRASPYFITITLDYQKRWQEKLLASWWKKRFMAWQLKGVTGFSPDEKSLLWRWERAGTLLLRWESIKLTLGQFLASI